MKAETGHTPGPWRVEGPDDEPYGQIGVFAAHHLVCELWQDDAPVRDYNEAQWANARLIAAAPELLAALVEMREFIRIRFPDDSLASGNWPTVKPLVEKWDAAIAKAEGKVA
jgi:hypothetical protein